MAIVTKSEFVYIPSFSDGTTFRVEEPEYDEMPDGYGGFGAPHCVCGELAVNCPGACQEPEPTFEDFLAGVADLPF